MLLGQAIETGVDEAAQFEQLVDDQPVLGGRALVAGTQPLQRRVDVAQLLLPHSNKSTVTHLRNRLALIDH